jgi:SAM-dependent methyltransferase
VANVNPANGAEMASVGDPGGTTQYYGQSFWRKENRKFAEPHFRMEKSARIVNGIARGKESYLLDVGCGPATLAHLLDENIHYHGIDIAIQDPAPNLIEADFLKTPIRFGDKLFDIVLAQGAFEYVEASQSEKLAEIGSILADSGKFIVSYWNFGHRDKQIYSAFSNIRPINQFREDLTRHFKIDKFFPTSHNWHQHEPGRKFMKAAQMHINANVPFISPILAVEYFFICSLYGPKGT